MRICIVSDQHQLNVSGVGTYAQNLIASLKTQGHSVHIIQSPYGNLHAHESWIPRSISYALQIRSFQSQTKADLIHFLDARESLFTKVSDIPVIGTMNDDYFTNPPPNPFAFAADYYDWPIRWGYYQTVHFLERFAIAKLTHVIACSSSVKESIRNAYSVSEAHLSTIYYGISAPPFSPAERHAPPKSPSLCFIGSNAQRKGLPYLLKAFVRLSQKYPDLQLRIIGKNPSMNYFRKKFQAEHPHFINRIQFLGQLSNLEAMKVLSSSSLYVMPSLMEGFGLTFLEAMQFGIPVIGGNVGGACELITDSENGFLVQPRNVDELSEKISILLSNQGVYDKFRQNGFLTVKKFSLERMTQETINLYEKMV